ncbi:MAG: addiction module protein [bacterium]|nr:addiction module protein [bacterium]
MDTTLKLVREIEKLSPVDQLRIIDRVIRDVIKPNAEIDKIWVKEAAERWIAYKKGEIAPIRYDQVMAKYKK